MRQVFDKFRPSVVIHLAALAGVRSSIERPLDYAQVYVGGTANVLELCREFRVDKLIFGSSSSVYGATSAAFRKSWRVAADFPLRRNQAEQRIAVLHLRTSVCSSGYLPPPLYRLWPAPRPDLAIYKFTALLEAGKPLPVFGDGQTRRDYTYVDDLVAGILRALPFQPRDPAEVPVDIFNLGISAR